MSLCRTGQDQLFPSQVSQWKQTCPAVLLRLAGVPTRLVAGFRLTHGTVGGVLTVRSGDAHAWLEFWDPARGWMPLDPTPRLTMPAGWGDSARKSYEWVSGYWYRYILTFSWSNRRAAAGLLPGAGAQSPSYWAKFKAFVVRQVTWSTHHAGLLAGVLAIGLGMSALIYSGLRWKYPSLFSIRHRIREADPALRRERLRFERQLVRLLSRNQALSESQLQIRRDWQAGYDQLRFGRRVRPEVTAAEVGRLSGLRRKLEAA